MQMHLYYNGNIHVSAYGPKVDWLLCAAGKILASGHRNNRPDYFTTSINLNKKTVVPAFTDAHTHFTASALNLNRIQLDNAASLKEALFIIKQYKDRTVPGEWIRGGGYNKNIWPDGTPHKKHLDAIFPDEPVALESKDYHSLWVNSKALETAGIYSSTPDPQGGKIGRDVDGALNGILYEKALNLVYNKITLPSDERIAAAVRERTRQFIAFGITTVHSMEGIGEFRALQKMRLQDELKMRVHFYIPKDEAAPLVEAGIQSGFGSDWLRIAGVKFFTDGSLGSQTAHMILPYENSKGKGIAHISEAQLKEEVLFYNQHGLSAAIHAIGDAAVLKTVNTLEMVQKKIKNPLIRNRIEHAQLVSSDRIKRFARLNITASMQPVHIADDVYTAEKYWGTRCAQAYPFRQFTDTGVNLAFGSDTPVADINPFKGLYSALERKYHLDPSEKSWYPKQALTLPEALHAYTTGAARAIGMEKVTGTLEPGKTADFIVLDRDIFSVPVEELLAAYVLKTVLSGEPVFEAD